MNKLIERLEQAEKNIRSARAHGLIDCMAGWEANTLSDATKAIKAADGLAEIVKHATDNMPLSGENWLALRDWHEAYRTLTQETPNAG